MTYKQVIAKLINCLKCFRNKAVQDIEKFMKKLQSGVIAFKNKVLNNKQLHL